VTAHDWLAIGWAVGGLVLGLVAANWVYSDRSDQDRGFMAACAFMLSVAAFPLIAGIGLAWLLFVAGAWLLPAYRREWREKREETRRTEAETARVEIDKLHAQVGLPPVDWSGNSPRG